MTRKELLETTDYWLTTAALNIFRVAVEYIEKNNLEWSDLENLGINKKTLKLLKNGDLMPGPDYYDVACRLGYQPVLELKKNKEEP